MVLVAETFYCPACNKPVLSPYETYRCPDCGEELIRIEYRAINSDHDDWFCADGERRDIID